MFLQGHISKYPELLEMLFPTYLPTYLPTYQTQFLHGRLQKAKFDVNWVGLHPQLSHERLPMDWILVAIGSLWLPKVGVTQKPPHIWKGILPPPSGASVNCEPSPTSTPCTMVSFISTSVGLLLSFDSIINPVINNLLVSFLFFKKID